MSRWDGFEPVATVRRRPGRSRETCGRRPRLRRALAVALIGKKMGAGGEQEAAELPLERSTWARSFDSSNRVQKRLRQVFRRVMIMAAMADEWVERMPVGPAELGQGQRASADPRSRAARIRLQRVLSNGSSVDISRLYHDKTLPAPLGT